MALHLGAEVLGVERGYSGLITGDVIELSHRAVGGIMGRGGTFLGTTRCPEFQTERGRQRALRALNQLDVDGLVVIGGNGTLTGALELHRMGFPVVGVPATIDNDVNGTDIAIGVDTALNTIVDAIDKIRDTASSHTRAFLVETMGRMSGYLAVQAGIVTGAEMVLIPEVATPVAEVAAMVEDAYRRGKTHCIIVVAEGFRPRTTELGQQIDALDLGFTTRVTILGHIQRGGKPTAFDRLLASRFGTRAVEFLLEGKSNVMVGLQGREMVAVPIQEVISNTRQLPAEYIEMARMLAK